MASDGEIFVVPFFGQGHLFPSMELCKHLCSRNFKITLIIPSNLSSSIPTSLLHHPLIEIANIPEPSAPPPLPPPEMTGGGPGPVPGAGRGPGHNPFHALHDEIGQAIEGLLSGRPDNPNRTLSACAVIDVMMGSTKEAFWKFEIPTVAFFTSGACSAAVEYGAWKAQAHDMNPGEVRIIPGLPEDMALAYSDVDRRPMGPPPGPGGPRPGFPEPPGPECKKFDPPRFGSQPPWVAEVDGSIALLINTCEELEHPFLHYIADQIGKPVWGVGPLLPEQYWKSAGSALHDRDLRPNRESNYSEDDVIHWLDSKPPKSVIYVSFGTEVGRTAEEYAELADALAESNRPFIWVIRPGSGRPGPPPPFLLGNKPGSGPAEEGYHPHGLDKKVGDRGLIIQGWAPQLIILSHPATAGFLSHCGWNSTAEAIVRGVPLLAWPIRGDQFPNAKLVVSHLKVGYMVSCGDPSKMVKKEDIVQDIERLLDDEEVQQRATALGLKFKGGFPASLIAALDAFGDFVKQKAQLRCK